MPSGSYLQVDIICPFYVSDDGKRRVTCEGVIPGTRATSVFPRSADFLLHVEIFCQEHYQNCEMYQAIMGKYEGDDEDDENGV